MPVVLPVVVPVVLPVVVLPVVLPVVVLPVVLPEVDPLVEPEVLVPEVEPDVLVPEVEPDVLVPEVEPSVVPLAFSVVVQLSRVSDEQKSAPVSAESHLRFIRKRESGKIGQKRLPVYTGPSQKINTGFSTGKNGFITSPGARRARWGPGARNRRAPRGWVAAPGSRAATPLSCRSR